MRRVGVVGLAALLSGCASAQLAVEAGKVPDPEPSAADAESYALDPSTVSVEVNVRAGADYTLRFKASGALVVSPSHPLATSLEIDIDTASADASLALVADVAKSSDFLSVGMYPSARLASRAIAKDADGAKLLYGAIELHGTSRTIRVPVSIAVDACKVDVSSDFALNRHDYHVDSTGSIDGVVGDTVIVRIRAHPARKNAASSRVAVK